MKLGFIGIGNMGSAIMGGIIGKGICSPGDILGASPFPEERQKVEERLGIRTTGDNLQVVKESEIVFLAVKPQIIPAVAEELSAADLSGRLFISIVAGKSLGWYEEALGKKIKLIRTMPNTPALVGEGMTAVCPGKLVKEEDLQKAMSLLGAFGKAELVPEHLMDAVVAVSGSSPAYVFMLIEAMADAAVSEGMPRALSYKFAAQAVYGSAKMVLETGKHPGELKDMVCSPAGTTIEAVRILEEKGFRSAMIEAMKGCAEVNRSL
ncbi:MAG: pyrroline-5-carboxylate reductase [Lachnospiraceae bacterium]|nr:pyrroline-5-carboxylate reductase [Lachnospiraceae bacterium]